MNKYQYALNDLINQNYDDIEILQELVDKEIPMKPIKMEKNYYICGSCEYHIPNSNESKTWHKIFQPYCTSCGQKIDWAENENNSKV